MTDREYMVLVDALHVAEKRGYEIVAEAIRYLLEEEDAKRKECEAVAPF